MSQQLILMQGFTHSGKSTLARKMMHQEKRDSVVMVEDVSINKFVREQFPHLETDRNIIAIAEAAAGNIKSAIKIALVKGGLELGKSVLVDAAHLEASSREQLHDLARSVNRDIMTVLVPVCVPEPILLARLKKSDQFNILNGREPYWVDYYLNVQKPRYQPVEEDEADLVLSCPLVFPDGTQGHTIDIVAPVTGKTVKKAG
jgi:predicted kinase